MGEHPDLFELPVPAPRLEPEAPSEPPRTEDEWAGLRQVLAGDDPSPEPDVDDAADSEEHEDEDAPDRSEAEELRVRVEELAAALAEERAEREQLADQLDRMALELDAVLGEALADERSRRERLEETLRQVQENLSDDASQEPWTGVERRSGTERRTSAGERRRGGPRRARPLRAGDVRAAPEDAAAAEVVDDGDDRPSVWRSRLQEVTGSVSAWSSDDVQRLRND